MEEDIDEITLNIEKSKMIKDEEDVSWALMHLDLVAIQYIRRLLKRPQFLISGISQSQFVSIMFKFVDGDKVDN